jgi:predicted porin
MNKSLLSALVLAGFAGAASAQVSLYGLLDVSFGKSIADDAAGTASDLHFGGDSGSGQGNSTSRIGIKGSTDVGSGVKGNFRLETNGITSDGAIPGPFFNRQAWVGFSGNLGEIRLGRQDSVPFQTMIGYDFNGASNGVSALGYAGVGAWGPTLARQSRSIQYILPAMSGFTAQFGLVPKGTVAGAKSTASVGVTFAQGAFSVSGALETKRATGGSDFKSLAASYDLGVAKLMVATANGGATAKGQSFGVVAPIAGVSVGMLYGKNSGTKGSAWEIFANKEILKNTYAYAEIGKADAKTGTDGQGMAIGLIYTF